MILAHGRNRLGLEHLVAVAFALVEDHLAELDVVARGAVETAATHVEFRILFEFERNRRQRPVGRAGVHADQALALGFGELEAGVAHAKRGE